MPADDNSRGRAFAAREEKLSIGTAVTAVLEVIADGLFAPTISASPDAGLRAGTVPTLLIRSDTRAAHQPPSRHSSDRADALVGLGGAAGARCGREALVTCRGGRAGGQTRGGDRYVSWACATARPVPSRPPPDATRGCSPRCRARTESAHLQELPMPEEGLEPPTSGICSRHIWLGHQELQADWTRRWTQPHPRRHAIPRVPGRREHGSASAGTADSACPSGRHRANCGARGDPEPSAAIRAPGRCLAMAPG